MKSKEKKNLTGGAIISLGILAVFFDLIGLIPIVKTVAAPIFWIIAGVYFWHMGYGIFSGKKLAATLTSLVTSVIPFVQELPIELSAGFAAIVIMLKAEYKTGISLRGKSNPAGKASNYMGTRRPNQLPRPLNDENGTRQPSRSRADSMPLKQSKPAYDSASDSSGSRSPNSASHDSKGRDMASAAAHSDGISPTSRG